MDQSGDWDNSKKKKWWGAIKPIDGAKQIATFSASLYRKTFKGQILWASVPVSADVWSKSYQQKDVLVEDITDTIVVLTLYHLGLSRRKSMSCFAAWAKQPGFLVEISGKWVVSLGEDTQHTQRLIGIK